MKIEKYNAIKKALESGRWEIDLTKGKVYSSKGEIKCPNPKGYYYTVLRWEGKHYTVFVHEIIAIAIGLYPVNMTVDHIDNDNQNNKPENLQVLTREDNTRKQPRVLSENQKSYILSRLEEGITQTLLAKELGITQSCISQVKRGAEGLKGTQKRLTVEEKEEIYARLQNGERTIDLSKEYGVSRQTIYKCHTFKITE